MTRHLRWPDDGPRSIRRAGGTSVRGLPGDGRQSTCPNFRGLADPASVVGGRHPLREPQRYPLRTTSTRPVPEITTITAVGDIMLGRRVGDRHRADPGAPLKPLAKRLASAEITIGNFRVDYLYRGITYPGWRLLRRQSASRPGDCARPDSIYSPWPTTTSATTGARALRQTLSRFSNSTIDVVGAGRNLAQARRPVIVYAVKRTKVRVPPGVPGARRYAVARLSMW